MNNALTSTRSIALVGASCLLALGALAGCSDSDSTAADSTATATQDSTTPANSEANQSSALDTGDINFEAEPVENLSDGDTINVTITGLNPNVGGYYTAICAAESTNSVPDCTGSRDAGAATQHWISKKDGATVALGDDGAVAFSLSAASSGENVDCAEQECVLKLFGDHSEGFETVLDIPVRFG